MTEMYHWAVPEYQEFAYSHSQAALLSKNFLQSECGTLLFLEELKCKL
jgi:hypothetical protein